jgi:hypothetical protein
VRRRGVERHQYVVQKASVSYSWEVEEHMLATAPRIELVDFARMLTGGP